MKKKNLKSLKLNKVEIVNLKFDNIFGGISGSPCKRSKGCTDSCPVDDDPSNAYTGPLVYCVTVAC
ncbi:MAG: hypothetical protein AB8B65_20075 [Kordia sp.]|uniref:hypothetical protein n=1 Tax=Kordia sp. TaxID=1965332 RepID=UPI003859A5FF